MMIRIGIIGFGRMGRRHYSKYQSIDRAQVVAISDVDVGTMRWLGDSRVARYVDPFEPACMKNHHCPWAARRVKNEAPGCVGSFVLKMWISASWFNQELGLTTDHLERTLDEALSGQ